MAETGIINRCQISDSDQSQIIISITSLMCMPVSGLEYSSVLIDARIWYPTKPVRDLRRSRTRSAVTTAHCLLFRLFLGLYAAFPLKFNMHHDLFFYLFCSQGCVYSILLHFFSFNFALVAVLTNTTVAAMRNSSSRLLSAMFVFGTSHFLSGASGG